MAEKVRRAVLGIDAAWTDREPSGVALIVDEGDGWRLVKVAASYKAFLAEDAGASPPVRHRGSGPDPEAIIDAASSKIGTKVDVVAIDMPLSTAPITGRRASDNMISSLYGARHASTHTPSAARPGRLSDELRIGLEALGYPLAVSEFHGRALIEVYPHPALIELAAAERRLAYKHSKIRKYWPDASPSVRRTRLFEVWGQIVGLLDAKIDGVAAALTPPPLEARGYEMKAFEDMLDAVVCAWVGACSLDGKASAHGDGESAIWVPMPSGEQERTRVCDAWIRSRGDDVSSPSPRIAMPVLEIYVDGSFDAATGYGSWAFVIMQGDRQIHSGSGATSGPSNNTFEVMAVIQAIAWQDSKAPIGAAVIWTDSAHVFEGCDRWRHIWRGNGWKRVRANSRERRRSIPDANLWQQLDTLLQRHPYITVQLCEGHSGIAGNEMADAAAKAALADKLTFKLD